MPALRAVVAVQLLAATLGGATAAAQTTGAPPPRREEAERPERGERKPFAEQVRAERWEQYRNRARGFRFEYPADFFTSKLVLPGDAGETFEALGGRARLAAFALPNPERKSLDRVARDYLREAGNPRVDYRRRTRNGALVVSGYRGDDVFYLRVAPGRGDVQGIELSYPAEVERAFDPIVGRISLSFRPGR